MAGSVRITASGVVGVSGKPVRIFGYTMRSGDGGVGVITLYEGTGITGTEKWKGQGNVGSGADKQFAHKGKFFPAGCYADIDSNVDYVDFDYLQENVT